MTDIERQLKLITDELEMVRRLWTGAIISKDEWRRRAMAAEMKLMMQEAGEDDLARLMKLAGS